GRNRLRKGDRGGEPAKDCVVPGVEGIHPAHGCEVVANFRVATDSRIPSPTDIKGEGPSVPGCLRTSVMIAPGTNLFHGGEAKADFAERTTRATAQAEEEP